MSKLEGVHPVLARRIGAMLDAMNSLGFPMMVTDGVRTTAQQQALYAKGRTAPGKKVTNVDGVTKKSNHQPKADGYGYAVDCCFLDERGKPSWADTHPWRLYGEMAKAMGLTWGGDWTSIVDKPHVELPEGHV